ncbi:MAG: TRAP transporter large permease [Casimicrobiaceae bacterium]
MATAWMIGVFLALAAAGVPVCAAMGLAAFLGLTLIDAPLDTFVRYMQHDVRSVPLLAIPFFILAGNVMNSFGLTRRIFDFIESLVGWARAGLAQVTVLSSVMFGGISGSALADIAGIGTMQIDAMKKAGYRAEFAAALTLAASLLVPLIPPSIMFIIYAVMMNISVGDLFIAGIIPGLVMAAVLAVNNYVLARAGWEIFPPAKPFTARKAWSTFWRGLPALLTPIVILRSMITGLTTPTEASVLAVVYALFLAVIYRELNLKGLREAFLTSARTTALIMFLTGVGSVMSFVIISEQVAEHMAVELGSLTDNKWAILCLVTFALLVLGCFMETVPAMLISIPLFGPLVVKFGIDPIHFGVILTYVLLLGIVHPPVGLGLFTMCAIARLRIEAVAWATLKFYPAFMITLALFMFIPELSTWLPAVVFKRN